MCISSNNYQSNATQMLLNESVSALEFQKNNSIDGFPITGWSTAASLPINTLSNPRFTQFWNLSTLIGGGEALAYMKDTLNLFYEHSCNEGFLWYYDPVNKKQLSQNNLPAYLVGDNLMALLHIYEQTNGKEYLDRAQLMADQSIKYFLNKDNYLLYNFIDYGLQPQNKHNTEVGNVTLLIDSWLYLYEITGNGHYYEAADKAIEAIWNLRNEKTNLLPEIFNVDNGYKDLVSKIGTGGEFMETLYYAWFVSGNSKYLSIMESIANAQLIYFWNPQLNRFVESVNVETGAVINPNYEAIRLESNVYSLIRLSTAIKNPTYAHYAIKHFDTYVAKGLINGLPVEYLTDKNDKGNDLAYPGTIYPFIKSAAMISEYLHNEKYMQMSVTAAENAVKILKMEKGYAGAVDLVTGEMVNDNTDIGGVMWLQNEGYSILVSILLGSPQLDSKKQNRLQMGALAENSLLRGVKIDVNSKSLTTTAVVNELFSPFCFNFPANDKLKIKEVVFSGVKFVKLGNCVFPLSKTNGEFRQIKVMWQ